MRKSYLENDTLWIVNKKQNIAIETRNYGNQKPLGGLYVTHNIADWHSTRILEILECDEKPVPSRFYNIINDDENNPIDTRKA